MGDAGGATTAGRQNGLATPRRCIARKFGATWKLRWWLTASSWNAATAASPTPAPGRFGLKLMLIQVPGMVTDMVIQHMVMDTEDIMVDTVDIMVDTDIHTHTDTDITSERDLLMLNQKQKHLLTQAHGTDMADTDVEATDMVILRPWILWWIWL